MRNRSVARFRGDVHPAGTHGWVSNMGMRHAPRIVFLQLTAIVVDDYDAAIAFFVDALGFELVEDSPSLTNAGNPKRWVVVRPPGAHTGILLARADGADQLAVVGTQVAGRVGFFLRVDDFDGALQRMAGAGVEFVSAPRNEPYGRVAVFLDIAGNRWDLLGPPELTASG
jgi:catechol 2,3-dioxygenase-like lactoylglutathione lyase family enzyme